MSPVVPVVVPTVEQLWRALLPSEGELRRARTRLHRNATTTAVLLVASYLVVVLPVAPPFVRILAAGVLVLNVVALATGVMHDANHGSFSTRRWVNRTLSYTSDLLGASSWLWRIQHNQLHHGNTNVAGYDADLELYPFAKLAPSQPWRRRFRFQHLYIWPLYGFLTAKNLLVSDFVSLVRGHIGHQPMRRRPSAGAVGGIAAGKLVHVGWALAIPLLFNPWQHVLVVYMACSWLVGLILAVIFQMAHCVDSAEMPGVDAPRRGAHHVEHQLATTVDVLSPAPVIGPLFRWIAGGLDHQIVHHLAPGLPHTLYPRLAADLRAACGRYGYTYRVHPGLLAAVGSHQRWLREMGRRPVDGLAQGSAGPGAELGAIAPTQELVGTGVPG